MTEKEMLSELLTYFYTEKGNLHWGYKEDVPLNKLDKSLTDNLLKYISDNGIISD